MPVPTHSEVCRFVFSQLVEKKLPAILKVPDVINGVSVNSVCIELFERTQ